MSKSWDFIRGKLGAEEVFGVELTGEQISKFEAITAINKMQDLSHKGADLAIAHSMALRGLNPTDLNILDNDKVHPETPVIFSMDKRFNDRGLLMGYVATMKLAATINNWSLVKGFFAYKNDIMPVLASEHGVLIGQTVDLRSKDQRDTAIPDTESRFEKLAHEGWIPRETHAIASYVVYSFAGQYQDILDQALTNQRTMLAERKAVNALPFEVTPALRLI